MQRTFTYSLSRDRRGLLAAAAALLGLGEFINAFDISFWEGAAIFSALFVAAAAWTRRGGIGGPILLGTLCVFELQSFPTWKYSGAGDRTFQIVFICVSATTLLLALAVLRDALKTRRHSGVPIDERIST